MKEIDLHSLASANGQDLVEFIAHNSKVIGEVTAHIANLETLKGTSQAHALGYQEYLPEEVCINDMSTMLSKKGYQISLESLASVLLVAASAAVVAGIGIIAYKLMKASMNKEPKAVQMLEKQKQVHAMYLNILKIHFTGLKPETQEVLKTQFLSDCVKEATQGFSDADILNKTFDFYMRSEMLSSHATLWQTTVYHRGEAGVFVYAASAYVAAVKQSLEAFRRDFLDIIARAPDITDFQMVALLDDLKWEDAGALGGSIAALQEWAKANNLTVASDPYQTLGMASDTLVAEASVNDVLAYDPSKMPALTSAGAYGKFYDLLKSLKETSTYISGAKGNFVAGEKRSQQIVDRYKEQVDRAVKMTDSIGLIEKLVRMESESAIKQMSYTQKASHKLLDGVMKATDRLTDQGEVKEIKDAIKSVIKETARMMSMKMESIEDRPFLGEMMALEGHSPLLEFMKVLGIALLIGFAVSAMSALIMSMLGIASFKAAWSGGLTYMDKNGKKITMGEGAKAIADKAKEKELGKFAVEMLSKNGRMPFGLGRMSIQNGYGAVERGIKQALTSFSGQLHFSGTPEQMSAGLISASEAGIKAVRSAAGTIETQLKFMGLTVPKVEVNDEGAIAAVRTAKDAFFSEWFDGKNASYDKIANGINNSYWGLCDKDAPDQVEAYAEKLTADVKVFGSKVKTVSKENMEACSSEAREKHSEFIQSLAYLNALGGVFNVMIREGMRQQITAMACVRASIKMMGESNDGVVEFEEDATGAVHYDDPIDHIWDQLEGTMEMEALDQYEMVTENWQNAAKTGLIILGVMALMGVGALIIKNMVSTKRSPEAGKDSFDKIAKGQAMAGSLDEFADHLLKAAAELRERANDPASVVSTQTKSTSTADIGREINPTSQSNDASTKAPESAATAAHVDAKDLVRDIEEMVLDLKNRTYKTRLQEYLEDTESPKFLWGATMQGPKVSFGNLQEMRDELFGDIAALCKEAVEEVLIPILDVATAVDPNAAAEKIYDKVVSSIEKITKNEHGQGISHNSTLVGLEAQMEEGRAVPSKPEQARILGGFSMTSFQNADVSYRKEYKSFHMHLQELGDILDLADVAKDNHAKQKLDALRGQRNKASSLLLRVDEFRPYFTQLARALKLLQDFGTEALNATEQALRLHRRTQKEFAEHVKKAGNLVAQAKLIYRDIEKADKLVWLHDMEKSVKELQTLCDNAGL